MEYTQYTQEERETIIRTDDLQDYWEVESFQRKVCTKIRKIENVEIVKETITENGTVIYGLYKLPYNQLTFRNPRVLTQEQRENASERLRLIRKQKGE